MNKLLEFLPGAKLGIARVRPIKAGVPASTNHAAGVTENGAMKGGSMKKLSLFLLCAALVLGLTSANLTAAPPQATVYLGSAGTFAVLGGTSVTNTGQSVITGDLGVWPGTSVTGFPPGRVIGTMHVNDPAAQHARASLTIAFNDAKGRTGAFTPANTDLSGVTLTPGLYRADTILLISGGKLYLKGDGVYIFQIGTGLTVRDGAQVVLEDGAQAANIFWQVGSKATLGSGVVFEGNILAGTAITMKADTTLAGRALAKAEVTFISNTVTMPRVRRAPRR